MAAKKARKRAYIPPSNEVVNRREHTRAPRPQRMPKGGAGGRGRRQYEPPQPSLKRTLRRLPLYFVMIFALQFMFAGREAGMETQQRIFVAFGSALVVTIIFAPFMHAMDRFAYNRYLKRSGKLPQQPTDSK